MYFPACQQGFGIVPTVTPAVDIKEGYIFWVNGFPPLDGSDPTRRPCIVIDFVDDDPVVVVGVTTDLTDPERIDLPNLQDEPGASTGLPLRCCAIPRWIIQLERTRLFREEWIGCLPQVTLA